MSTRVATTGISKDERPRGRAAAAENTRQNLARRELLAPHRGEGPHSKSKARIERATALINTRAQAAARW